jgi:hypothetical protein
MGGPIMSRTQLFLAVVGLVSIATSACAEVPTAQPANVAAQQNAVRQITLPPNSEIVVTPNDTVSSKSVKVGDKVRISTRFDVMQDGYVVIPRGTVGEATIAYRTGKGAFGKSAKMEIEFNWLDLNGRKIPLSGKHRQEGEGNTGAAVGTVVAVGPFGAFVTGHSATLTNGQELRSHTVEPLVFELPANVAPVPVANLAPAARVVTAVAVMPVAALAPASAAIVNPAAVAPAGTPAAVIQPAVASVGNKQ